MGGDVTRSYDRNPRYAPVTGEVARGWAAAVGSLPSAPAVLAVDGPAALDWTAAIAGLLDTLRAAGITTWDLDLRTYEADWDIVRRRTGDDNADPHYLKLAGNGIADVYRELPRITRPANAILVVHGPGAALLDHDVLWYADLPKRYAEAAIAAGDLPVGVNLGRRGMPGDLRRLFYADWPMSDGHRDTIAHRIDRWIDLREPENPASLDGPAMRATLARLATGPVRSRPYFNSTPWGGQWAARELGFTPQGGNTALGYELIAPEAGVLVGGPEADVELPFQLLCVLHPVDFLGPAVHAEFGTSFPIRFDYLDTVGGGNLSLHLHPRAEYMRERFGWPYTQHESYYVTASPDPESGVYLGLQQDADLGLMRKQVELAIERGEPMDVERFVQRHPAAPGQLFLIPAGTPHASGSGNLVLEISATPYLYSLRFYDWLRRDAHGNSRPLPYAHTHGRQRIADIPPLHLMQQGSGDTYAAAAQRMTDGYRTPIDIYLCRVQPQLADTGKRLYGKSLVQLHQIQVLHSQTRPLKRLLRGRHRTDAHNRRVHPRDRHADDPGDRFQLIFFYGRFTGQ